MKLSYTLLAPLYDLMVAPAFKAARRASLAALPRERPGAVLVNGVGSGLDLPLLPSGHRYIGLDLTRAMLERCARRAGGLEFAAVQGDSLALPFRDGSFDHAVLHLILAIVPDPVRALSETARVVRPGGVILVMDKFLRRGERALLRRALSPITQRLVTRLDVVFEDVVERVPAVRVASNEAAAAGGWFRRIRLDRL